MKRATMVVLVLMIAFGFPIPSNANPFEYYYHSIPGFAVSDAGEVCVPLAVAVPEGGYIFDGGGGIAVGGNPGEGYVLGGAQCVDPNSASNTSSTYIKVTTPLGHVYSDGCAEIACSMNYPFEGPGEYKVSVEVELVLDSPHKWLAGVGSCYYAGSSAISCHTYTRAVA